METIKCDNCKKEMPVGEAIPFQLDEDIQEAWCSDCMEEELYENEMMPPKINKGVIQW